MADTEVPRFPALAKAQVPHLPPAAYYIPDFITKEEEALLLRKIGDTPQPKWKTVGSGRRLQYWGGTLSKSNTLVPEPMPPWLASFPNIIDRIDSFLDLASGTTQALGINQVLINEYKAGQGISPHQDGPAFRPLVATLSLGSHTVLDLHHYISASSPSPPMTATATAVEGDGDGEGGKSIAAVPLGHVLLLPRSLFILTGSLYSSHLHGIEGVMRDTCCAPPPPEVGAVSASASAKTSTGTPTAQEEQETTPTPAAANEPAPEEEASNGQPPPDATAEPSQDPAPTTDDKSLSKSVPQPSEKSSFAPDVPIIVANADLLDDRKIQAALYTQEGWSKERGTRTSLTFRRANKTAKAGLLALAGGGRR